MKHTYHSLRLLPVMLSLLAASASAQTVKEYAYEPPKTFGAINGACVGLFDANPNPRNLANSKAVLEQVKECILYGVDTPINLRPHGGEEPAYSIPRKRYISGVCAPFESCFNKTSTLRQADPRDLLYQNNETFTGGGTGGRSIRTVFNGPYDAPQFDTATPDNLPPHLKNGGSVTIYDGGNVRVPEDSLVNPDNGTNFYAENGNASLNKDSTIHVPPAVNGQIAQQAPIIVMQDSVIQFSDGGLIHLPAGFEGTINGRRVTGGQWVYIAHNGKLRIPSGTGIYPMPAGSTGMNPGMDYTGPSPSLPSNVAMRVNDRNQPGDDKWW